MKRLARFKNTDFEVKLGSILKSDMRDYYMANRFTYLEGKLASLDADI